MTLTELARLPRNTIPPRIAAEFLECQPYALNVAARMGRLALAHYFSGNRLHISKVAILEYCGYTGPITYGKGGGDDKIVPIPFDRKSSSRVGWLK